MKQGLFFIPLAVALLLGCETEQQRPSDVPEGALDLRIALEVPEYGYQISSTPHVVKAGTESTKCDIVKVSPQDAEKLIWLGEFESLTSKWTHHMNVYAGAFSVLDAYIGEGASAGFLGVEPGQYDCDEIGDIMESGAYPVYPSQKTHQTAIMPKGVAIPGIVPLVLVMEHHYINTTDDDVYINAAVNFHRVDEADVDHVLTGFYGIGDPIEIPPNKSKLHDWTCKLNRDINMVAISSHSHERGDCFTMSQYDRKTSEVADDPFFVNDSWDQPPILFYEPGEWTLNKGAGVHWACHYTNREDRMVVDGPSARDEMCIFVGVGYPSKLSVEDVKELAQDPLSVDPDQLLDDALVSCDPVTTVTSPWPNAWKPQDRFDDICGGYLPTTE